MAGRIERGAAGPGGRAGHGALAALWVLAATCVVVCTGAAPGAGSGRSPFAAVAGRDGPSVVNIRAVRSLGQGGVDSGPLQEMFRRFFPRGEDSQGPHLDRSGTGSGFVVSADGLILTNHHVVAGADSVTVRFSGERVEHPAVIVGSDANTDLALLRIDAGRPLTPLEFGDSDAIAVGDWAIAIGNPFGNLEGSVTVGVISAKGRGDLVIAGGTPRYQDFIQTDASINFGNSGGPLVDIDGRVIGVNTAVNTGGQGISFAVPSNLAQRVCAQLRAQGRVIRGWIGVSTVREAAAADGADGARVTAVVPGSPAAAAGLAVDDLIVEFGGRAVADDRGLQFLVAEAPVGVPAACLVVRAGQRRRLSIVPTELPAGEAAARNPDSGADWLGMRCAALTDPSPGVRQLKEALGVPEGSGVIVVTVRPEGPAAAAGIRPGDVVVAVAGRPIGGLDDLRLAQGETAGRQQLLELLIRTGTMERVVQVRPERPDSDG
ncbi:MAG: trypsin-like peptidase domain-containing protein [Candidatus Krumholzibacteriia bacterium]